MCKATYVTTMTEIKRVLHPPTGSPHRDPFPNSHIFVTLMGVSVLSSFNISIIARP